MESGNLPLCVIDYINNIKYFLLLRSIYFDLWEVLAQDGFSYFIYQIFVF